MSELTEPLTQPLTRDGRLTQPFALRTEEGFLLLTEEGKPIQLG